ncbi:MAG: PilZ domain-containing protein [Magnetococcales bacterium]|nr:PilZ domain-containing protein [Magnetococcales bacterium]
MLESTKKHPNKKSKGNRAKRVRSEYPVSFEVDEGERYAGTIENISESGLFFTPKENLPQSMQGKSGMLYLLKNKLQLGRKVRVVRVTDQGLGLEPLSKK